MDTFYMMNRFLIIVSFIYFGCENKPKVYSNPLVRFYSDYNFCTMEGINEIDQSVLKYPFVSLFQNDTFINIVFNYSNDEWKSLILRKSDDYWICPIDSIKEDEMQYFQGYYRKGFKYSVEFHLEDGVKILDQLTIITPKSQNVVSNEHYFFNDDKMIEGLPWDIRNDDWKRKDAGVDSLADGKIYMMSYFNDDKDTSVYSIHCYKLDGYPINFFYFSPSKFSKIKCDF